MYGEVHGSRSGQRPQEDSGQYTETVTNDETIEFVQNNSGLTTNEVATNFDYERLRRSDA